MKRQRGRNRGGSGGSSGGGGGKPQQQNANRAFDSNGPDNVKVRGNAQHVFEKYQQLARDAGSGGDRVLAENYLQHAEHYFRLVRALQPSRPASEIIGRDQFASGYDIDFEDEALQAQAEAADEAALENGGAAPVEARQDSNGGDRNGGERSRGEWQDRPRDDRQRDDRQRDDRPRDDRPRDDRPRDERPRDDRPRDDRPRDDRPRGDAPRGDGQRSDGQRDRYDRNRNRNDRPRDDRPRDDRPRDDRPRSDGPRSDGPRAEGDERPRYDRQDRGERAERQDRDPMPVVQPQGDPAPEKPRAAMLRDAEGGESHAPAFLQARPTPAPAADTGEEPVKRAPRRRKPKTFEAGEGGAGPETEDA